MIQQIDGVGDTEKIEELEQKLIALRQVSIKTVEFVVLWRDIFR